jgi:ABC-2 type transport system ATP-binding protein
MHSSPVIRVSSLTRRFNEAVAVDAISFELGQGQVCGLLGGNGAGKTTTISMLLGLLIPDAGSIEILGMDLHKQRCQILPHINFSSPYVDLPRRLTVRENLIVYARLYSLRDRKARIAELAEQLMFSELLDRTYGTLSAGQKTRVALAKALLNRPQLLLLDEPTASLDPDSADRIRGWLEAYVRDTGASVLLASHNMAEVERLCDQVLLMRKGAIVDRGTPTELLGRYERTNLEQVFLDVARHRGYAAESTR